MITASIKRAEWSERAVTMRLPFKFGNTEVRGTAEAYCTLQVEIDGRIVEGHSAQLMVPRWFDKRENLSNADTVDELRAIVNVAIDRCVDMTGSAIAISRDLRAETIQALPTDTPALAAGFGPALIEMALIDAICRATAQPFWQAARSDLFGLVEACPPDLPPEVLKASLSDIAAPTTIRLRHTIGFGAPLLPSDIGLDAPDDGLPICVEDVLAATGISAFKIKLKGDPDADLAWLHDIAGVLKNVPSLAITLDANEQYDPAEFSAFLSGFKNDGALGSLRAALRFIEQPFAREIALTTLGPVDFDVALVIDESDDSEDAFPRALALGWSGTSIKSCKGVLRALLNRARAKAAGAILSGEDLTCQPGLCWEQDTAMAAACGVQDVERNGHHFAGGMQGAPQSEIDQRLVSHSDIYASVVGRPTLRIENGHVNITSLEMKT